MEINGIYEVRFIKIKNGYLYTPDYKEAEYYSTFEELMKRITEACGEGSKKDNIETHCPKCGADLSVAV